jgi:16S rRNA C967 or C1407 C5-methylase (RsmB/RsmF family)
MCRDYHQCFHLLVLAPSSDDIVLDLCSAPGSKTTQMAEMMNNDGTLVVNEIEIDRIKSLVFNLDRMSIVNTRNNSLQR